MAIMLRCSTSPASCERTALRGPRTSASTMKPVSDAFSDVDVATFTEKLYQWAATLTTSSMNLPLALPLRVNRTENGFEMGLLRMRETTAVSVADITATVEPVDGTGQVLFVRFFEAEGSDLAFRRRGGDDLTYLGDLSRALVDVPKILNSMPPAIRLAVVQSR